MTHCIKLLNYIIKTKVWACLFLYVAVGFYFSREELCCFGVMSILILPLALVTFGLMVPSYQKETANYPICKGDTIGIPIPSSPWTPSSVEFELVGPISDCKVSIAPAAHKKNVQKSSMQLINPPLDHLYLVEGSRVIVKPEDVNSATTLFVWLFPSYELAYNAKKEGLSEYKCDNPTGGALCIRTSQRTTHTPLVIKKSAYYFMRCDDGPSLNCSSLTQWEYNQTTYNFNASDENDTLEVYANAGVYNKKLRSTYSLSKGPNLFLAQLSDSCYESCYSYFIVAEYTTPHIQELGLYFTICLMVLLLPCLLSIILYFVCWRSRTK